MFPIILIKLLFITLCIKFIHLFLYFFSFVGFLCFFFIHYYICVGVYIAFSLLKQYNIKLIIINCNYYILSINFMLLVYNSNSNNNLLCLLSLCAKSIVFCNTVSIHLVRIVFLFFFCIISFVFFSIFCLLFTYIYLFAFLYMCVCKRMPHIRCVLQLFIQIFFFSSCLLSIKY